MRTRNELTSVLHLNWVGYLGNEEKTSQPSTITSMCYRKLGKRDGNIPSGYEVWNYKCIIVVRYFFRL